MARRYYSNIAVDTTLASGIGSGDLSLTVADASGWPAVPFCLVIDPDTADEEVVLVGAKSGTLFSTLTRGYDGTSGVTHNSGAEVRHVIIAADVTEIWTHDHDTGSGYAQVDHGDLAGLGDDDHSQYHNNTRAVTWHDADDHSSLDEFFSFGWEGVLDTVTGTIRFYPPFAIDIQGCRASLGGAPAGSAVIVDINRSGTTIYTTQGNRPQVAASGNVGSETTPDVSAVATSQYITIDIDQVGSSTPGSDLTVTIRYRRT